MTSKYQFAKQLVLETGAFLRLHVHDELQIEEKSHFTDLVTHLDKEVQERLVKSILKRYPEDAILGEESEERALVSKGQVWVIDPIDGTTNFIVQRQDFAILLAYFEDGVGQFAFIYDVMADRLFHGDVDGQVYENDTPLPYYQPKELSESLVGLNAGLYAANVSGLADFANQTLGTRCLGSAGLSMSQVFSGRLLAYAGHLYPWDYAPASVLAPRLGYQLMTLAGQMPSFDKREYVILLPEEKINEWERYRQQ